MVAKMVGWTRSKDYPSVYTAKLEQLANGGEIDLRAYEQDGTVMLFVTGNPRLSPVERQALIQLLDAADAFALSTDLMIRRHQRAKEAAKCANCEWTGLRSDLQSGETIESYHPLNSTGRNHATKWEACPKCGRWIYADGKLLRPPE